jgi:D-amino-acid dehydrogenase
MTPTQSTDIVIIGAGVLGVSAAYYLWRAGHAVTVLDQGEVAAGSSYGNAGLVVPSHVTPLAAPGVIAQGMKWLFKPDSPFYIKPRANRALASWLWKFRAACNASQAERAMPLLRDLHLTSLAEYKTLAGLEGLDFGFETRGLLHLYAGEQGAQECREMAESAHSVGLDARLVGRDEVAALNPGAAILAPGGVYFPDDAHLDPARFVRGLARYLEERGVVFHTGRAATGFQMQGKRIAAVKTDQGPVAAEQVVLAGGAWSPAIARSLKLNLPIQAAKGYSFMVDEGSLKLTTPLLLAEAKIAVTPLGGRIRFAGTLEMAGMDLSVNRRRVEAMRKAIPRYLEGVALDEVDPGQAWAGLRPCTPDGLPLLGRAPRVDNLVVAAGHAMQGLSLGPISGKLVAEVVAGETPSISLGLLEVGRFG